MTVSIDHILVPVDGSESALHAARFAAGLATALAARITLLYVVQPASTAQTIGFASLSREELHHKLHEEGASRFRAAAGVMAPQIAEATVDEVVELGAPASTIVRVAADLDVDLVVMGSRGLTPLSELLLGSVSEAVVRRAGCPVTVVR